MARSLGGLRQQFRKAPRSGNKVSARLDTSPLEGEPVQRLLGRRGERAVLHTSGGGAEMVRYPDRCQHQEHGLGTAHKLELASGRAGFHWVVRARALFTVEFARVRPRRPCEALDRMLLPGVGFELFGSLDVD